MKYIVYSISRISQSKEKISAACDRFIRNYEILGDEKALINNLLTSRKLKSWELRFCERITTVKNRSPKQKQKLREIAANELKTLAGGER